MFEHQEEADLVARTTILWHIPLSTFYSPIERTWQPKAAPPIAVR
jgi:hypothetical protein